MMPHDILALYSAKAIEYLIAVGFLLLFVPFWRYVMGGAPLRAEANAEARSPLLSGWFQVPERTYFHPGHAWARVDGDGLVTLGVDDFAQKLVGPMDTIRMPAPGTRLVQGEPAWSLGADSVAVDMVAPVGGVVVDVNTRAIDRPDTVNRDPYGSGWLMKVRAAHLAPQIAALRTGQAARRWMDDVCESLASALTPSLGLVYQDGGFPVDGIARAISSSDWPGLARRFLLTDAPQDGAVRE
jgi:glycine cleavage system H lipoate-binding protein